MKDREKFPKIEGRVCEQTLTRMRPFILIELLIAFALVSASVLPFIRFPLQHLSKEIDTLYQMELERETERAFVEVKEALLQNKIDLSSLEKREWVFEKNIQEIHLSTRLSRKFERIISLKPNRKKRTKEGEEFTLYEVEVDFFSLSKSKAVLHSKSKKPKPLLKSKMSLFSKTA